MQPVSGRWMTGMLANSLTIVSYGEVWTPPSAGNPVGTLVTPVQVFGGTVAIDATNAIRRTATGIQCVPFPIDAGQAVGVQLPSVGSALFPEGNELKLFKGLVYPDGTSEAVGLGRFLIEDVEVHREDTPGTFLEISGRDRGGTISRAKFTAPFTTALFTISGLTLDRQIRGLIDTQVPHLTYNITPSTFVPAAMNFNIGDDPWTAALALAATGGYELFPDVDGTIVGRPTLNPAQTGISATYTSGPQGIITKIKRSLVNTTVPNVIVVESQGSGVSTPLVSYWWDSNPASATYYAAAVPTPGSNMHSLPSRDPAATYPVTVTTTSTQAATTQLQSDTMALSLGFATAGTIDTFDVMLRDNPAHDADDVVQIQDDEIWPDSALYVIDGSTVQMGYGQEQELKGRLVVV